MVLENTFIEVKSNGVVSAKQGSNKRTPYDHQKRAMENLDIVSGSTNHDRTIDITPKDSLLIASKDSIGRNMDALDKWLKGEKEVYLVIDDFVIITLNQKNLIKSRAVVA